MRCMAWNWIIVAVAATIPMAQAQQTPYGSCALSAQHYQDAYERHGRVADMVCLQKALERELASDGNGVTGQSPAAPRLAPKESTRSIDETFCEGQPKSCLAKQYQAGREIDLAIAKGDAGKSAISDCTHYTTGGRSLGSAENVDKIAIARCLKQVQPKVLFNTCVASITGKQPDSDSIFWGWGEANAIAQCFNSKIR